MTLDVTSANTANTLLNKFGKTLAFVQMAEGAYDPATGEVVSGETVLPFKGFLLEPNASDLQGGQVTADQWKVMVKAADLTVAPEPNDQIEIDTVRYTVTQVDRVWSGELVVLYYCFVAKN